MLYHISTCFIRIYLIILKRVVASLRYCYEVPFVIRVIWILITLLKCGEFVAFQILCVFYSRCRADGTLMADQHSKLLQRNKRLFLLQGGNFIQYSDLQHLLDSLTFLIFRKVRGMLSTDKAIILRIFLNTLIKCHNTVTIIRMYCHIQAYINAGLHKRIYTCRNMQTYTHGMLCDTLLQVQFEYIIYFATFKWTYSIPQS